ADLIAVENSSHMLPLARCDGGAADGCRISGGTLIEVESDFTSAGDRELVPTAAARHAPILFAQNVLVVAGDGIDFYPGLDCDWTTDAQARTVRHTDITARAVER